jgi:hypothetical protein
VVEGEAMRKLDARFNALWRRVQEIELSQSSYTSQGQVDHLTYQINNLKKIMIQAGILIESTELEPTVYPVDGKLYAVRKVK